MDNNKQRRKIVLGLVSAAGAGQLGNWSKPVIDTVILPAHAETTDTTASSTTDERLPQHFYDEIELTAASPQTDITDSQDSAIQKEDMLVRGLSLFVSEAHAQLGVQVIPAELCIDTPDGIAFTAKLRYGPEGVYFHEASGTIGGGPASLPPTGGCPAPTGTIEVTGISAAGAQAVISIVNVSGNATIPENPGCPQNPGELDCREVIVPVDR